MACATLKRSLDLDPLYTPRPTKRRRCITMSPSSTSSIPPSRDVSHSPFAEISSRLTKDSIVSSIREEMKRFHRRRQLHFGDSPPRSIGGEPSTFSSGPPSPSSTGGTDVNLELPSSPTAGSSGSSSLQLNCTKIKTNHSLHFVKLVSFANVWYVNEKIS